MVTCNQKQMWARCVLFIVLGGCGIIDDDPDNANSPCVDAVSMSDQLTMLGYQKELQKSPIFWNEEVCSSDVGIGCASFIHLHSILGHELDLTGFYIDLVFTVNPNIVEIRNLRLGDNGLADMAALKRKLSLSTQYDLPNAAGQLHDLDKEAEIVLNGMLLTPGPDGFDLWIRADGLRLQVPGDPAPIIRYGFASPDPACDNTPAQIGDVCGSGTIS